MACEVSGRHKGRDCGVSEVPFPHTVNVSHSPGINWLLLWHTCGVSIQPPCNPIALAESSNSSIQRNYFPTHCIWDFSDIQAGTGSIIGYHLLWITWSRNTIRVITDTFCMGFESFKNVFFKIVQKHQHLYFYGSEPLCDKWNHYNIKC